MDRGRPAQPALADSGGTGCLRLVRHRDPAGSTLRLTLGCLLANELGIELRRVGTGQRLTFAAGEKALSRWMAAHARVCWHVTPEPWSTETILISQLSLRHVDDLPRSGIEAVLAVCDSSL